MQDFPFNLIIIPAVIMTTAVVGVKYTKQGVKSWYTHIKKPTWTPPGSLIGEVWTFLYVVTGLAVLWYWNVPVVSWPHYVVAVILLLNAYLNATWNRTFFVEHNIPKAYKRINQLNATTIIATIIMFFSSAIGAALMLPYIAWVSFATYMTKEIMQMNDSHHAESHHNASHQQE